MWEVPRRPLGKTRHTKVEYHLGGKRRPPILKEEFWQDEKGEVTRYSLAYIDASLYAGDNGRVLGYDNAHGQHHRHFMGATESYAFTTYEALVEQFEAEVQRLRRELK